MRKIKDKLKLKMPLQEKLTSANVWNRRLHLTKTVQFVRK